MAYITRLSHFRFEKSGDELLVTSERDDSFEARYDWPDDLNMTGERLVAELHERYYNKARRAYLNE
jgi:hypothetical protein